MPTENQSGAVLGKTNRTIHCCLDVRGSLKNMTKRQLTGMFRRVDGTKCTADEAKDHLLEALAQGKEVLPFGPPCEGFDYSGNGCPGHDHDKETS
ncbi:hypothetical protein D3C87_1219140 [compost metagenome]|jgi:hypothetical protein